MSLRRCRLARGCPVPQAPAVVGGAVVVGAVVGGAVVVGTVDWVVAGRVVAGRVVGLPAGSSVVVVALRRVVVLPPL
jgi:hypothetical protein